MKIREVLIDLYERSLSLSFIVIKYIKKIISENIRRNHITFRNILNELRVKFFMYILFLIILMYFVVNYLLRKREEQHLTKFADL